MESIGNPLITPSMAGWPGFPKTLNMDQVHPYPYVDNPYRYPHHNQFQNPGKMRTLYGSPPLMDSQKSFGNPKLSKPQVAPSTVTVPEPQKENNRNRLYQTILVLGGVSLTFLLPYLKQTDKYLNPQMREYARWGGTLMMAAGGLWMLIS
jgi:hypothetical protein